jgi:hypothetical protein
MSAVAIPVGRWPGSRFRATEPVVFLVFGFLLCLAVRMSTLDQNFWEQELVAAATIEGGWTSLVRDRLAVADPPLYYLLLKALGLAGASELTLRIPSAVLDSAACGLLALCARKASGRVGGLALVLCFSFMPVLIRFGQEARPYPLLAFFFAAMMASGTVLWRAPRQAAQAFRAGKPGPHRRRLRAAALVMTVAMVGAGWTMVIGWGVVLAVQLSAIMSPRLWRVRGMLRLWLTLSAAAWLAIIPCIVAIAPGIDHFAAILWTPDRYVPTLAGMAADFGSIYGWGAEGDLHRFFPAGVETYLGSALLALAAIAALRPRARPPIRQAAFVAVLFPAVLFAADAFRTLVVLRHIHPALWALCLLYADGAAVLARRRLAGRIALVGLAAAIVLQGIDGAEARRKTSWEPFLQFFHANRLGEMPGYVTEPALAVLIRRSLPAGSPPTRIELAEDPAVLRAAVARALSADAPFWILTSRPLVRVSADLPTGIASCSGVIGYHSFILAARSADLLPDALRDCLNASPGPGGPGAPP